MAKLAVITERGLASGFALAGVEVYAVDSASAAKKVLLMLMENAEIGIIALHSGYLNEFDEATRRRVSESYRPVIVAVPVGLPMEVGEKRSEQIAEMIRRAIGFRITFRGG
jgi:vacuolar-type H+-ATPase subunit F/Vma7